MKYFKNGDILLSDFDGVYFDSQTKFNESMQGCTDFDLWMDYLNNIDWHSFYAQCQRIPDAKETLLELQKLEILKGFITRIHSFYEGVEKTDIIRKDGFYVPIYFVLPKQPKSDVFTPTSHTIILEDDARNTEDWEQRGGRSILYNPHINKSNSKTVKKLSFLLKK